MAIAASSHGMAPRSPGTRIWIAVLTAAVALANAIPAGCALARLKVPLRGAILLPQAVPNLPVYGNIARVF